MSDIIQFNSERFGSLADALSHLEAVMFQDRTPLTPGIRWEQWAGSYLNTLAPSTKGPLDSDAQVFTQEEVVQLIGPEVVSVQDFLALVGGALAQRNPDGSRRTYSDRAAAYADAFAEAAGNYSALPNPTTALFLNSLINLGEPSTAFGWQIVEIVRAIQYFGEGAIDAALISRNNANNPPETPEEPEAPEQPAAPSVETVGDVLALYNVNPAVFVGQVPPEEFSRTLLAFAQALLQPAKGGSE